MGSFRYRMIADKILADIKSEKYLPGASVPSSRELSSLFSVSQITAVHALNFLAKRGVLQHKPGKNYCVARKADNMKNDLRFLTMLFRSVSPDGPEFYGNRIISGVMHEASQSSVGTYFSAAAAQAIRMHRTDFSRVREEALMVPEQNLGFIADFHIPDKILEEIIYASGLPAVVIGRECQLPGVYSVILDALPGYRFLLQTLKRLGYQAFICCENHDIQRSECLQQRQFFRELAENEDTEIIRDHTALPWITQRNKLQNAVQRFKGKRTAVFFANDYSARNAVACFEDWNLKIPGEIGIAGFYGTRLATEIKPNLCCLSVRPELLGRTAVQLLLAKDSKVPVHRVPMEFVFGETI